MRASKEGGMIHANFKVTFTFLTQVFFVKSFHLEVHLKQLVSILVVVFPAKVRFIVNLYQ